MISLFLKYAIIELSIDKFFKSINGNFKTVPDICIGSKFRKITIRCVEPHSGIPVLQTYNHCEITSILTSIYLNEKIELVTFVDDLGNPIMCNRDNIIFKR